MARYSIWKRMGQNEARLITAPAAAVALASLATRARVASRSPLVLPVSLLWAPPMLCLKAMTWWTPFHPSRYMPPTLSLCAEVLRVASAVGAWLGLLCPPSLTVNVTTGAPRAPVAPLGGSLRGWCLARWPPTGVVPSHLDVAADVCVGEQHVRSRTTRVQPAMHGGQARELIFITDR